MRVLRSGRPPAVFPVARRFGCAATVLVVTLLIGTNGTQDAVANGDTRTLSLYHNHTKEGLTVTFRRNGRYDPRALEQLNWFLRDWRRDEPTRMDPRLFDTLWEVYRESGSGEAIHVNSAYRSPQTNSMLRRRSRGVAKNSQHMLGKAMDFYLPDVPMERVRALGIRLQDGGVGYYPNAYTPFVHLDVGSVRAWPRMTRDQLVRLFPDGKTVHIPADGEPLPRYEEARAEVLAKGGSVAGYRAVAEGEEAMAEAPRRKGFWATLFGWADEDEDAEELRVRPTRTIVASRRAPPPPAEPEVQEAESAPAQAPARAVQPPTRIAGVPGTVETPNGPRLDWQQGPASPVPAGSSGVAGLAFAPIPPRRPEEGNSRRPEDVTATGALAYAPLPPVRPGSLAATNPIPVAASSDLRGSGPMTLAALSELGAPGGPSEEAPEGGARFAPHPLPPRRPADRPVAVAALGPLPAPGKDPARLEKPAPAGAPGKEPARLEKPAPASAGAPGKDAKTPSRLPVAAAGEAPQRAPTKPAEPQGPSRPAAPPAKATLAMGFNAQPMGDLSTNRFTGPAVKPLTVR